MRSRASLPSEHFGPWSIKYGVLCSKNDKTIHFTDQVYSTVFGNFAKRIELKLYYSNDAQNKQKYFQEKHRIKEIHKLLIS